MATYPSTIAQCKGSQEEWVDPIILSIMRSGGARGRRLQLVKKRKWSIRHALLTNAQKTTVEAFWDANRSVTFLFPWVMDGVTYTVIFIGDGMKWDPDEGVTWTATFEIREF